MEPEKKDNNSGTPWYYSTTSLIIAFICVGPFMLPLIWHHPTMSQRTKNVWMALIAVVTLFFIWSTYMSVTKIMEYYDLVDI